MFRLMASSNLGNSVQIDAANATVRFLDDEVQQSVATITRKKQEEAAEKEHQLMSKLVHGIESHNIRIVELMGTIKEKTNDIRLS